MLDGGQKIKIKNKIADNTTIILVERTSDKFKREQQHVLYTTPLQKDKKCHVFLKPWADATWERSDKHLSPDEAGMRDFYSINVNVDEDTGVERVVHTVVQSDKIKPNKP